MKPGRDLVASAGGAQNGVRRGRPLAQALVLDVLALRAAALPLDHAASAMMVAVASDGARHRPERRAQHHRRENGQRQGEHHHGLDEASAGHRARR